MHQIFGKGTMWLKIGLVMAIVAMVIVCPLSRATLQAQDESGGCNPSLQSCLSGGQGGAEGQGGSGADEANFAKWAWELFKVWGGEKVLDGVKDFLEEKLTSGCSSSYDRTCSANPFPSGR